VCHGFFLPAFKVKSFIIAGNAANRDDSSRFFKEAEFTEITV
jgi:hypothetical protein